MAWSQGGTTSSEGGVFLRTPLQRLIPIVSRLSLNLLKYSEPYYPCMRLDFLSHTAGQNSVNILPKL